MRRENDKKLAAVVEGRGEKIVQRHDISICREMAVFFVASCSFVSSAILRKAESELSDEIYLYLYVKFV